MEEVKDEIELNRNLSVDLATNHGEPSECLLKKIIAFELTIPLTVINEEKASIEVKTVSFYKCHFYQPLKLQHIDQNISFEDCVFYSEVNAFNATFNGKTRFRNCEFKENTNFYNSKFNGLADFWKSTFFKPITFYKTDFNDTAVFSAVTFNENVLFTYSLFASKTIFGRTTFNKGLDISQSIISGELQPFDLAFEFTKYVTEYIGNDDDKFRKYIHLENKIPLINKVATFQVLKNTYAKQSNHIDEITMRQQEKKAYSQLTQFRKLDKNWTKNTSGDRFILWLNRWSNNYKSDFRNGILFTSSVAIIFLLLTLTTTEEFWNHICFNCEIDWSVIGYTVKQFINFLNPAHSINYIDELYPFYGIPYVFDFLGRIAVGYGIYQTVQAFRKFR
jgi:hypothetical protein